MSGRRGAGAEPLHFWPRAAVAMLSNSFTSDSEPYFDSSLYDLGKDRTSGGTVEPRDPGPRIEWKLELITIYQINNRHERQYLDYLLNQNKK